MSTNKYYKIFNLCFLLFPGLWCLICKGIYDKPTVKNIIFSNLLVQIWIHELNIYFIGLINLLIIVCSIVMATVRYTKRVAVILKKCMLCICCYSFLLSRYSPGLRNLNNDGVPTRYEFCCSWLQVWDFTVKPIESSTVCLEMKPNTSQTRKIKTIKSDVSSLHE